jgi:hypothetical protein
MIRFDAAVDGEKEGFAAYNKDAQRPIKEG